MVLHPSADFLIKGINTMVTLHLYTIWIQDCTQLSYASYSGSEHLDYCLFDGNLAKSKLHESFASFCSCHILIV